MGSQAGAVLNLCEQHLLGCQNRRPQRAAPSTGWPPAGQSRRARSNRAHTPHAPRCSHAAHPVMQCCGVTGITGQTLGCAMMPGQHLRCRCRVISAVLASTTMLGWLSSESGVSAAAGTVSCCCAEEAWPAWEGAAACSDVASVLGSGWACPSTKLNTLPCTHEEYCVNKVQARAHTKLAAVIR